MLCLFEPGCAFQTRCIPCYAIFECVNSTKMHGSGCTLPFRPARRGVWDLRRDVSTPFLQECLLFMTEFLWISFLWHIVYGNVGLWSGSNTNWATAVSVVMQDVSHPSCNALPFPAWLRLPASLNMFTLRRSARKMIISSPTTIAPRTKELAKKVKVGAYEKLKSQKSSNECA